MLIVKKLKTLRIIAVFKSNKDFIKKQELIIKNGFFFCGYFYKNPCIKVYYSIFFKNKGLFYEHNFKESVLYEKIQ